MRYMPAEAAIELWRAASGGAVCRERKARLKAAEREISALKGAIRQVAFAALSAISGSDDERLRTSGALDPANADKDITALVGLSISLEVPPANGSAPTSVADANGASTIRAPTTDVGGVDPRVHNGASTRPGNGGSASKAAMMKDRSTSGRATARAHNGARPSDDVITQGAGSSTRGRRWPLGGTWPFRKGSKEGGAEEQPAVEGKVESAAAAAAKHDTCASPRPAASDVESGMPSSTSEDSKV
jgi:hypothetical protein